MLDYQLHTIDLHFLDTPEVIASYAIVGPNGAALIETGPRSTLPRLLDGLRQLGVQPSDVRDVLVTHIHLDHAGAAGWWAQQGATIHVHPVGAPHLINPSKLIASAARIYGDKMDALWGEITPAPPERVRAIGDGDVVEAGGAALTAIDSPGHAWHHHCYRLNDSAFVGDVAGVRLPGHRWLALPSPPPEFDLEAWRASLARLSAMNLKTIYPTHYGAVNDPADHFRRYAPFMSECAEFVRQRLAEGLSREAIAARYRAWLIARGEAAGIDAAVQEHYSTVNNQAAAVDGLIRYWTKKARGE